MDAIFSFLAVVTLLVMIGIALRGLKSDTLDKKRGNEIMDKYEKENKERL
jgi:hypothetical protein